MSLHYLTQMYPPFSRPSHWLGFVLIWAAAFSSAGLAQTETPKLDIDWNKTILISKSTATLQVVTNPMLNPGSPIHDGSFAALKALGADYVRYVPWLPYPKIAVAELEPPSAEKRLRGTSHTRILSRRIFSLLPKAIRP